jgi:hypothetical protein
MSLIPSESYSFPDHFTKTVTPSRKPKEEKKEKVEAPPKKPKIVALPDPVPEPPPLLIEQESEFFAEEQPMEMVKPPVEPFRPKPPPVSSPVAPVRAKPVQPNPAMLRATAPPPKIPDTPVRKMPFPSSLKPKVRWNHRAPAMDPAPAAQHQAVESAPVIPPPNIIPMQPKAAPLQPPRPVQLAPAMRKPVQTPAPAPIPAPDSMPKRPVQAKPLVQKPQPRVAPNPQGDFFEVFSETAQEAAMRRRRQMKFRRFIACEVVALVVLAPLVILGFTLNITTPALHWLMNLLTITAAISATVIPIVFYAFTPTLPELER